MQESIFDGFSEKPVLVTFKNRQGDTHIAES